MSESDPSEGPQGGPGACLNPGWKVWVAAILLCVLYGWTSVLNPFGRDQGIHAYTASQALKGQLIYRDIFNVKPPMTTPTHALALVLFGHNMTAIRWLDLLITIGVAAGLVSFCWLTFRSRAIALCTVFLFVSSYFALDYWNTAQTDGWTLLPTVLSMLGVVLLNREGDRISGSFCAGLLLVSGMLIGVAVFYKYTVGLILPAACLTLFLGGTGRARILRPALVGTGFGIVCLGVLVWLHASGAWEGFLDSQIRLNKVYAGVRSGPAESAQRFLRVLYSMWPPLCSLSVLALVLAGVRRKKLRSAEAGGLILVGGWVIAALASPVVQGKYFAYHLLPLLAPMAILAGWGLVCLWEIFATHLRRTSGAVLCVVAVLALTFSFTHFAKWQQGIQILSGQTALREYWRTSKRFEYPDFALRDDLALAQFLEDRIQDGDRVNIWGFEPLVNFLVDAPLVSRFLYSYPCVEGSGLPQFRAEYIEALRRDPPEFFVVQRGDAVPHSTGHARDSYTTFENFEELKALIERKYRLIGSAGRVVDLNNGVTIPRFHVYRRTGQDDSGA